MKFWQWIISFSVLMVLTACTTPQPNQATLDPEANYWQSLDDIAARDPSISQTNDGIPFVAYEGFDGTSRNIYVKRWNGSSWVQLGTTLNVNPGGQAQNAHNPSLALDSSGNPVVSWWEWNGVLHNLYVKRWNGSSWVQLGPFVDANLSNNPTTSSLALDSSGNPVVSWQAWDGTSHNIYVKRWTGSSWVSYGGLSTPLDANTNRNAQNPSLALDSSGNPVVSWEEGDVGNTNIYLKRWNGSSWVYMGSPLKPRPTLDVTITRNAINPSLALDSSGNPVVSWEERGSNGNYNIYVKRWSGTNWQLVGTSFLNTVDSLQSRLSLDAFDNPVVSWFEKAGGPWYLNLYIKRWNGSSWNLVESGRLDVVRYNGASLSLVNGNLAIAYGTVYELDNDTFYFVRVKKYFSNSWLDVGSLLDVSSSQSAVKSVITRKSNNIPVVAWDEVDSSNGLSNVYVKEWNGSLWSILGGAIDRIITRDAKNPSIAMRVDNKPTVAFQENNHIYVRSWSGTAWTNIGGALDTVLSNSAITPSIALDSGLIPVVAFAENGNILVKKANGVIATSVWNSLGTTPLDTVASNMAYRPSVALKSDNNPVVAWYEKVGTNLNIYAKEWNGTSWVALGAAIDTTVSRNARDIVIAIRSDNRPVVAWEEGRNIYVKRWTGTAWVSIGGVLDNITSNEALRPSIDLRTDNNPVVSWQEWNGSSYDVWVKRWTGSTWALVASVADKNIAQNAKRSSIVLKSNNIPMICWDEWDGVSENIYVKQY